jgi:hypothetical protein
MRVDALVGDNARRARAWIRNRRADRDDGARAEDRFDRSARIVRRPPGSVCAGPSAGRGRGGRRGGRGSARSRPTASARARGSVLSGRRCLGSLLLRRRWRLVARLHLRRCAELASCAVRAEDHRLDRLRVVGVVNGQVCPPAALACRLLAAALSARQPLPPVKIPPGQASSSTTRMGGLVGVVVANLHHLQRLARAERDRVARAPREHGRLERRGLGGCPVESLELEV